MNDIEIQWTVPILSCAAFWKLPLIVQSDAVDIFNSFGTNYAYYTFKKKVYKAKAFTKLNLTHAIFILSKEATILIAGPIPLQAACSICKSV